MSDLMGPGSVWACRCYQVDGVKWSLWDSTSLSRGLFLSGMGETVIDWVSQPTLSNGGANGQVHFNFNMQVTCVTF